MTKKIIAILFMQIFILSTAYANDLNLDIYNEPALNFIHLPAERYNSINITPEIQSSIISQNISHGKTTKSPDGEHVYISSYNNISKYVIDTGIKTEDFYFENQIYDFCISNDDTLLAIGLKSGILIYNIKTKKEISFIKKQDENLLLPIAFDNETKTLIVRNQFVYDLPAEESTKYEYCFTSWDIETGKQIMRSEQYERRPNYVYDRYNQILYIEKNETELIRFNTENGIELTPLQLETSIHSSKLLIQPNSHVLLCFHSSKYEIINLDTGNVIFQDVLKKLGSSGTTTEFIEEGKSLVRYCRNNIEIRYSDNYSKYDNFDLNTFKDGIFVEGRTPRYDYAVISNNLKKALVFYTGGSMIADMESKTVLKKNREQRSSINNICYSESGNKFAFIIYNSSHLNIQIWDSITKKQINSYIILRNIMEHYYNYNLFFDNETLYFADSQGIGKSTYEHTYVLTIYKIDNTIEKVLSVDFPSSFIFMTPDPKEHRILIGHYEHFINGKEITNINDLQNHLLSTIYSVNYNNYTVSAIDRVTINVPTIDKDKIKNYELKEFIPIDKNSFLLGDSFFGKLYLLDNNTRILSSDNKLSLIDSDILGLPYTYISYNKQIISENKKDDNLICYSLSSNSKKATIPKFNKLITTPDNTKLIILYPDEKDDERYFGNMIVYSTKTWEVINNFTTDTQYKNISSIDATDDSILVGKIDGSFREIDLETGKINFIVFIRGLNDYYGWSNNKIFNTMGTDQYIYSQNASTDYIPTKTTFYEKDTIVNDGYLFVRNFPATDAPILGRLATDERIRIYKRSYEKMQIGEMNDYWYLVMNYDRTVMGWCYGFFLDISD